MDSGNGTNPSIRARGLKKTFGAAGAAVLALRGVNMDVLPGQLVMLVGPSGCGKTTLVSILSGVLDADEGDAEVYGVSWKALSQDKRTARRGELVGFVFQQFNLIPALSIQENAAVPLFIRGAPKKEAMDRAAAALNDVGLGSRLKDRPAQLSGGMQQRVAVARALVGQPALLVCDEPTANLDARTGQSVMELVHSASRGTDAQGRTRTVVVVTHDARIFHYADRIEEMEDGLLKDHPSKIVEEEARWVPQFEPRADDR